VASVPVPAYVSGDVPCPGVPVPAVVVPVSTVSDSVNRGPSVGVGVPARVPPVLSVVRATCQDQA